jgi:diguanylate cyclase (GGDEF)-like protein
MAEASVIAAFAIAATNKSSSQTVRESCATVGLIGSSAILVHFSGGLIEMHFHFFVMVAVVTLYQSWTPFLLAIAFVVIHHGTVGILDPSQVYNHPSAIANPWKWAFIHGLFIAGESAAGLTAWKMNERGLERERHARVKLQTANSDLAEAQSMAGIGSWDWDLGNDRVWWSDELYRIFDVSPDSFTPTYEGFMQSVHKDDQLRVRAIVEEAFTRGTDFGYQSKVLRPDGTARVVHALGKAIFDPDGSVSRMVGTVQDITDRKVLEERVEYQAFHDSLTGLANRALFLDRVDHALSRRVSIPLAVLFVDLDDFKTVNDSLGHGAGDELLVHVASQIHDVLRPVDTFARIGGDEFAILLEDLIDDDQAIAIAKRILGCLSEPINVSGTELLVRASIGIALSDTAKQITTGELLRHADTAMYAAKRKGKGSYELFQDDMAEAVVERLRMKADLQRAVNNQEFVLHYQPIIELDSGEITGVEALVRWMHPEHGMIPPLEFIPFAEETGLIIPLTKWVLHEACRTAAGWVGVGGRPITVAVNISAVRFRHPGLEVELLQTLEETGMAPERLVLEITESVLVQDSDDIAARLGRLKKLGVKIAIDDFGTGYSSLSYLRDFPLDLLKVDKSFIDAIDLGPEESALARAVIKLGRTLGLKVVAEGIEGEGQARKLQTLLCDFGQGYLFSKPVEAARIDALLKDDRIEMPPTRSLAKAG